MPLARQGAARQKKREEILNTENAVALVDSYAAIYGRCVSCWIFFRYGREMNSGNFRVRNRNSLGNQLQELE